MTPVRQQRDLNDFDVNKITTAITAIKTTTPMMGILMIMTRARTTMITITITTITTKTTMHVVAFPWFGIMQWA